MLDDKKIDKEAISYARDGYNDYSSDMQDVIKESFKSGAEWAINEFLKDLWHPASEEPVEDKPFLAQEIGRWRVGVNSPLIPNNEWSTQRKIRGIKRWLYVEDLLPKEGGEQ